MLRTGVARFKEKSRVALAVGLLWVLPSFGSGCYWSRYPEVMATHLQLIEEYATKLSHLAEDGRTVEVQEWGEFVYPLDGARDFARIAAKRFPERSSLARFDAVLARYGELVASPDVLTRRDALRVVEDGRRDLAQAIAATREALASEGS